MSEPEHMIRRNRSKILIIIAAIVLAVALPVALCIGITLIADVPLGVSMPTDCQLIERTIKGQTVTAEGGQPVMNANVEIKNLGGNGFEAGQVALSLHTDVNGAFSQSNISVFACDTIQISVAANGYKTQQASYHADQGYGSSPTLEVVARLVSQ